MSYHPLIQFPLPSSPPTEKDLSESILLCALDGGYSLWLKAKAGLWILEVWEKDAPKATRPRAPAKRRKRS